MDKLRNKHWRQLQRDKHYIKKLKWETNCGGRCQFVKDDGTYLNHPTWKDLYDLNWQNIYKSVNTPCSCPICQGERYNRSKQKRDNRMILNLQIEDWND